MVIESIKRYNWQDKTVLIVEEDHSSLIFLKEILGFTGIGILDTRSGEDAVFLVKKHRNIDIVLMDTGLSRDDPYDIIRRIKSQRKDLPVIAQTTHTQPEDRERSYLGGCDAFVAKPIDTFELLWKMDLFLGDDHPEINQPHGNEYSQRKSGVNKRNS